MNHVGQDGLDGVEGPVDVDGKEPTPKLVRDVLELVLFGDAGVVHQEVYRAERFLYGSDGGGDGVPVRDVGLDRQGPCPLGAELRLQRLGLVLGLQIVDAHGIALRREAADDGPADTPAPAGDESGLPTAHAALPPPWRTLLRQLPFL